MKRLPLLLLMILLFNGVAANAQTGSFTPFAWDAADLALVYPSNWDSPLPGETNGTLTLQVAQKQVSEPRPASIPYITLMVSPASTTPPDAKTMLTDGLQKMDVVPGNPLAATLLDASGVTSNGISKDGALYAMGRAAVLADGRVLVVLGRGPAEQRAAFEAIFDAVANSLVEGTGSQPHMPTYGVLWNTVRTTADGDDAFVNLVGLVYAPDDSLYALDANVGVVQIDAQTGAVLEQFPFDQPGAPTSIAISSRGSILAGDPACTCVQALTTARQWTPIDSSFGDSAPYSLAVAPDNTVYATDVQDGAYIVRALQQGSSHSIPLGDSVIAQPLLAVDRTGRLLALTADGHVLALHNDHFEALTDLIDLPPLVNGFTVDSSDDFVVATNDQGIYIYDANGNAVDHIGRVVPTSPLPGEIVHARGVVIAPDNTVYWADSDGSFGAITAVSTRVEPGRIGATGLIPHVPVQGVLNDLTTQQAWTFNGTKGQNVALSAIDADQTDNFNVALQLLAPDGKEEAANDDHEDSDLLGEYDAEITNHALKSTGTYIVLVKRVAGDGTYTLGWNTDRPLTLDSNGTTTVEGELSNVFPTDHWTLQGRAGRSFTITLHATSGTLDPSLRLLNAAGKVVAQNDDADDPALGPDAQLVQIPLPSGGVYIVEAARFTGEGRYQLVIVTTS